ncbi:SCO family protein [Piscinibacter sp.]|uniref:SCO family protein n=1 Tax=Piscinibacter sp. TaxID=1903157 RepID=UPI002C3629EC|nr:SCO family protein [Albitalea sp.]HUG25384.1 SCO family protein [Albitalea sp.]
MLTKLRSSLPIAVAAAALVAACEQAPEPPPVFQSTDVTGAEWGSDFRLTDHRGTPRRLEDFRGKVVLVFFGFTHCPNMCPTAMSRIAAVVERLGAQGEKVQGLFITVDPARDTAEVLARYVPAFHPSFLGLRGDKAATAKTAAAFRVHYQAQRPDKDGDYGVDHLGGIFAFDPAGRLRLFIRPEQPVDAFADDVRELLSQHGAAR